ncbi:MAG: Tat pathway signal sequence domain protein [Brevundimonas sp.]|uniref:Tat pathway signal sequence domain protein n=1 Tax=Brevundimonas sp. TaxID=1871086 RepID=UPI0025BC24C8|nr:Tat pathway signal sequence domain protein [Brevundimonas sp.]MBX3477781.1 Tat pathway signal sequence domain protein [Brevundimonas sp.]
MRRVLLALAVTALASGALVDAASAQTRSRDRSDRQQDRPQPDDPRQQRGERQLRPLNNRVNAGPCPFVKILYDGARYVEISGDQPSLQSVGFTGEIEGVTSDCSYRDEQPITLAVNTLFNLGRGPMAQGNSHTYRYWIAVTERDKAVLAKEYFDLPVNFEGGQTASVTREQTITIPRASATVSGANFEVLIGFEVTPEMAEFNRSGSRFRIQAGPPQTGTASAQ